jgi:CubicO group peptidase (beta-lactamase class C family)
LRPGGQDEQIEASYGVLNTETGVAVTSDSLFQIGSITKVWTTTVVMQLVEERLLELDAPILDVLPELKLADSEVTKRVTMRHLLTHTSGIDGDVFTDTGRGDDCVEKYVALLDRALQVFPLGATFSYNNAGFVLAGRVIEKLTGQSWDQAERDRLFTPLGLTHTVTLPEEALLFRVAVGHLSNGDAEPTPVPVWMLPRSVGPAGLIISTTADVLAFARMHLCGGLAGDGSRVLGHASVAAMQDKHADLPEVGSAHDSWGLGWGRCGWEGQRLVGHDGGTIGQSSFLRLLPEQGLAVVLLTNGNNGDGGYTGELYQQLFREIFAELANVQMQHPPVPPERPVTAETSRHVGIYEREGMRIEVFDLDGVLTLRMTGTGSIAEKLPGRVQEYPMTAVDNDRFLVRPPGAHTYTPVTLYSLPSGERFVHIGGRSTPRIA